MTNLTRIDANCGWKPVIIADLNFRNLALCSKRRIEMDTTMKNRFAAVALAVAISGGLAACSSDDDTVTTGDDTPATVAGDAEGTEDGDQMEDEEHSDDEMEDTESDE